MGEGNFTRAGPVPTTNETCVADGVMGRAEGTDLHEERIGGELVGERVDTGCIEGFFDAHFWQDTGHGSGKAVVIISAQDSALVGFHRGVLRLQDTPYVDRKERLQ